MPHHGSPFPPLFLLRNTTEAAAAIAGWEPAVAAAQDELVTLDLFQPAPCKLGWRLFDPQTLTWGFDAERYVEQLKRLGT